VEQVRRFTIIGACLLFGLVAGLVLRPDDGTQVSISSPVETGAAVSGANHGKPLPRVPSATDLMRDIAALAGALLAAAAVLVAATCTFVPATTVAVRAPRPALVAHAVSRRGPPARG
jgi:hypothetical protein